MTPARQRNLKQREIRKNLSPVHDSKPREQSPSRVTTHTSQRVLLPTGADVLRGRMKMSLSLPRDNSLLKTFPDHFRLACARGGFRARTEAAEQACDWGRGTCWMNITFFIAD